MPATDLPARTEVQAAIDALRLSVDASELHGGLCGLLCGGARLSGAGWLDQLALEPGTADADGAGVLDRLRQGSSGQLDDPEMGFQLLLPEDDRPVAERGAALIGWCRGFLGGFGLAAGANPPLSPEAGEALEDLARIAATELVHAEDEEDETALEEVAEFVRIAALLLHGDCVHGPRARDPAARRHLH